MCGILGVASAAGAVDPCLTRRLRDRLTHRGPDDAGSWLSDDGRVALEHRRLSIIDPRPTASQPFVSDDGRHVLVYNGEIYNFRALRRELRQHGHRFRTESDTEVLLAAYRRWGASCLDRLDGMWAFAIYDVAHGQLFFARDRVGEKPFYWAPLPGGVAFASEIGPLLDVPGVERRLDTSALADYLTYGFVPDPATIWASVRTLPPGHAMTVSLLGEDRVHIDPPVPWWDFELDPQRGRSAAWWADAVAEELVSAAEEMSFADVPVGAFLSGGVDSSSVVAALSTSHRTVLTYCVGFDEQSHDERPHARAVAALLGTDHRDRLVDASDLPAVVEQFAHRHLDQPFNDFSYVPTYYVCRAARADITVALTGDGGDELFCGYPKYRRLALRRRLEPALRPGVRRLLHSLAGGADEPYGRGRWSSWTADAADALTQTLVTALPLETLRACARGPLAATLADYDPTSVVRRHLSRADPAEVGLVNAMRYLDLKLTLGAGILVKVDRTSMAASLEARPVLLHPRLLDLARRIPAEQLVGPRGGKLPLRAAAERWLPRAVLDRPKQGFALPVRAWLDDGRVDWRTVAGGPVEEFLDPVALRRLPGGDTPAADHAVSFLSRWLDGVSWHAA